MAVPLQCVKRRVRALEPHHPASAIGGVQDQDLQVVGHDHPPAWLELPPWPHQRLPGAGVGPVGVRCGAEQEDLGGRARGLAAEQARGQHTALVYHQDVPGPDQLDQLVEAEVAERTGVTLRGTGRGRVGVGPRHDQEAALVPPRHRVARDPARRQDIVVV